MVFRNEPQAIAELGELVLDAAANLHKATKYIYSLSKNDFYHCSVKDALKIVLNNLFDAGALRVLNLSMDEQDCAEMSSAEYQRVFSLLVYSFAVRLPLLRRIEGQGGRLSDQQLRAVYQHIISKGVENHDGMVPEHFDEMLQYAKKGKGIPPYSADWYKSYIHASVPALADLSNRSLFLFGTVDVLYPMFYMCLEQELERQLMALTASE